MSAEEGRSLKVNTTVVYTTVGGTTKSIPPGEHWIVPVWAEHVPTGETELECWIITENRGTGQETDHDVDAETVADWQASGAAEMG